MDTLETLKRYFGHDAFREGQERVIDALLSGRDALAIMPTGAGKSVCYQIPALMLDGVTLVISPLISLMKDQVAALIASGVPAAYINSSLTASQQAEALRRASLGRYRIVYVAPERLAAPEFQAFAANARIPLVAVDEAHCVSQWGQDFRPSYRGIADFVDALPARPALGAFTATATPAVRRDIEQLMRLRSPELVTTGFDRPNLRFASYKPKDKYAFLKALLEKHDGESGIVYCGTRKTVEEVASRLTLDGFSATRYHAGLSDGERRQNQEDFQYDRARVMVATNAFGMGIDKSNVGFVAHYNMPKDLESYYQEAGRAGRDGGDAECVLLYGGQDVVMAKWLIEHGEGREDMTEAEQRALRARDEERLKRMTFYATSKRCLRAYILQYFGEQAPEACGYCSVCDGDAFELDNRAPRHREPRQRETRPTTPRKTARPAAADVDAVLWERLRGVRTRLAAERGVPAYVIFPDATLREMALAKPHTPEEMLRLPGVGMAKLKLYADAFLEALAK